ncbi:right-handed parallel beta-helix repeat-containing protein [Haloarcula salina]|uniref:Right-handed parallel beta-helix repeat-containing protein n=1 Tax=Haloarcula salina TaxID=1429914 RepID=A0AA41FYY8_9EURY|nr:right-handed parallel beta-helix repeat-containing protein [Haloarcula salina]MBV0900228.1 right-handed parallel beta-helix repeat-containing protein [Haloarcula salina]
MPSSTPAGDTQRGAGSLQTTRRSLLGSIGAAAGLGLASGDGRAQAAGGIPGTGDVYFVTRNETPAAERGQGTGSGRSSGTYLVVDGSTGGVSLATDDTADVAFQHAFDQLGETGGTVVASAHTFEFGGPATVGDDTLVTGQRGTRFVASETGSRDDPAPTDTQENPLPTGHDLLRVRGDNVAVTDVEFDGAGTQLDNQAVQADGCDGLLVANTRTVNGFQMGISFTRCTNVTVRDNEVVDPNWYGITSRSAPAGGDSDLRRSSDVVIAGNRVSGMKFNNIAPYNVSHFVVFGNVVFDGGHSLIACSPAQRGAIVGNVCRDLHEFAPDPGGEAGIEIEYKETHLRDEVAGTPAARSSDITIAGNQVADCPVGILSRTVPADGDATEPRREQRPHGFTITGNAVSGATEAGIRVRSGESGVVATNTLRDNGTALDVADDFTAGLQVGLNATRP